MDAPREEKKEKREKEKKEKSGRKEKKEKVKSDTSREIANEKNKERIVLPPTVQALVDRLVSPPADDATGTAVLESFRSLSQPDRLAFAKAIVSIDVLRALAGSILSPNFVAGGAGLCSVLWECFSADEEIRTPASALIPALLLAWLVRTSYAAPAAPLEALMQGLYGVLQRERRGEAMMFCAPQLSDPSVYHTPPATSHRTTLTADALARHDRVRGKAVQVDEAMDGLIEGSADAKNRMARAALRIFSDRITLQPPPVLELFSFIALRLVASGYSCDPDAPPASAAAALDMRAALSAPAPIAAKPEGALPRRRHGLSPALLSMLLYSLVFCLDTATARGPALQAISAVEQRAATELIPQVLVATSALRTVNPPPHS